MSIHDIDLTLRLGLPQYNLFKLPDINEPLVDNIDHLPPVPCVIKHFHFSCGAATAEDKDFLRTSYPWDAKRIKLTGHDLPEGHPPQPFRPLDINIDSSLNWFNLVPIVPPSKSNEKNHIKFKRKRTEVIEAPIEMVIHRPANVHTLELIEHDFLEEGHPPQPDISIDSMNSSNLIPVVSPSNYNEVIQKKQVKVKPQKTDPIEPPFEWATDHRAKLHTLEYILLRGINEISDKVKCKYCEKESNLNYKLNESYNKMKSYFLLNDIELHNRLTGKWKDPILPNCESCGKENCLKPIISNKKKSINWLFLFLGSFIGCCTLKQLKYFCKYASDHRTGAKDRLIYHAYTELRQQLEPSN